MYSNRIILAVDDEPSMLRFYRRVLEQADYQVLLASSADEALRVIDSKGLPHLIIVDLAMPEKDGFAFAKEVLSFSDVPLIFITAEDDADKASYALTELGDDYIRKPVSPRELAARINRSLERVGVFDYVGAVTRIDNYLGIDFAKKLVLLPSQKIALTPLESKLLFILVRDANIYVPTRIIHQRLWGVDRVPSKRLQVMVHRLRKKIEPDPHKPRYLVAQRDLGYKFQRPAIRQ